MGLFKSNPGGLEVAMQMSNQSKRYRLRRLSEASNLICS